MNSNNKEDKMNKMEIGRTTTILMVIVIRPIWSTYRMYVWNKFVLFDLLLNFIIQEEVEIDGDEEPVIIQFRTLRYRYNNNNNNKRRSGSLFCLREWPAHLVGINVVENGNASEKRSIFKAVKRYPVTTTTTKKTKRTKWKSEQQQQWWWWS